ncbi:MAG: ribosome maturation factor RimP [Candidatus Omnitrophica bacterium]|nr:ribosome maturation factor RimP [Candidatus Omnitrophota bacterium]MDD5079478.1 ribosome maturation factor RimP [Candidatus Omnitrophota bacterium]
MGKLEIAADLEKIIRERLESLGFDLVELICRYEGPKLALRVFADKPEGGINMDECAEANRALGRILEEGDLIKESFVLEVSSPGLDRVLRTTADFCRVVNKKVKFFLSEPVNGKIEHDGVVRQADPEAVDILTVKEEAVRIPLAKINKARRILE